MVWFGLGHVVLSATYGVEFGFAQFSFAWSSSVRFGLAWGIAVFISSCGEVDTEGGFVVELVFVNLLYIQGSIGR